MVVKSTSFQKSSIRAIKSSITRFISIILISFLGAGVFAGLAAVSPDMRHAGNDYYKSQNLMDARMLSTYGFSDEDVKAIENTKGVSGVMASYTVDAMGTVGDKDYSFRINGLSETNDTSDSKYINQVKMVKGRWPKNNNEAIIIRPSVGLKNITLGSTVSLNKDSNSSIPDTLNRIQYTIVGIADSSYYLSFRQGNTSVGKGTIDYVLYVPQKNFKVDGYTDLYVTLKGASKINTFEDEYFKFTDPTVKQLESLASKRQNLRHDQFQSDLSNAKQEYGNSDKEANDKLSDAKTQLDEGANKLANAKQKYSDGMAEYNSQKADVDQKLADAKAKLDDVAVKISNGEKELSAKQTEFASSESALKAARTKLDNGWSDYNSNAAEIVNGKAVAAKSKTALDNAQAQYDAGAAAARKSTGMTMEQIEAALPSMNAKLNESNSQYDAISQIAKLKAARDSAQSEPPKYAILNVQYQAVIQKAGLSEQQASQLIAQLGTMKTKIDTAQAQYNKLSAFVAAKNDLTQKWAEYNAAFTKITDGETQLSSARQPLDSGEKEYSDKSKELECARTQLAQAESQIVSAKSSYNSGLSQYNSQKSEAESKLSDAKSKLDAAAKEISNGESELAQKNQEYNQKKADVNNELSDAKQKIEDVEKKLSDLGGPKWYVLNRHKDESFVTYEDDTKRMHNLATVFPVIFFLVAALVSLTTMTRMVDEDRTLIGTFKALGYSNIQIAGRYLKYAAYASVIGSVLGVCLGFWLIPTIIWKAYGIVFTLPKMTPSFYYGIALLAILSTVFIITLSTGIAAKNSLNESPANLMLPKAPKSGKRVLLEYVTPVWSRLSFTQKVTVRNLGLNKKRLIMSLVGIVGCTALVVTAFGAKNAVKTIMNDQFGNIFRYNAVIGYDDGKPSDKLSSMVEDKNYFRESSEMFNSYAEASLNNNDKKTYNVYVQSPKESDGFTDFVKLSDPDTKKDLKFSDDSVIITQKLSMDLKVGVGDKIWLKYMDKDERHPVKITGITRNFTFNYVYVGKKAYESFW